MQQEIIPHLFRTEYRKIVAVLCKRFGFNQLETAEDIASDTFLAAAQLWPLRGIPAQPTAWLYQVAKNKALNHFQRRQLFAAKIAPLLQLESLEEGAYQIDLSEENILDSQLRMIFAICNPLLSAEAQIAMALRVLCGFGVEEIAAAFLSNKETIQKRLTRAKEKLRAANLPLECPSEAMMQDRLQNVLKTLYLLFNEGYYSHSNELLRKDLCLEAMRLTQMLVDHAPTQLPEVYALLALMCFQASRLNARKNEWGDIVLYADQDESQWNQPLLARGIQLLH
ncbi:MAG TPA: sigma-70 family RNA polymerase sigma factor, partial [Chitinophagaceae bacterium]|nr:sigma-70 family RNA polymerase sigma factor [Chitinophagaceae bacterium]